MALNPGAQFLFFSGVFSVYISLTSYKLQQLDTTTCLSSSASCISLVRLEREIVCHARDFPIRQINQVGKQVFHAYSKSISAYLLHTRFILTTDIKFFLSARRFAEHL